MSITIPCYIIAFNRVTWLRDICEQAARLGCAPIIVDNASTFPALLDWYSSCEWPVIRLSENRGHTAPWTVIPTANELKAQYGSLLYAVTDHDLDMSTCAPDLLEVSIDELQRRDVQKVGPGLLLDRLHRYWRWEVLKWEKPFWRKRIGRGFHATIDTTFAIYDAARTPHTDACRALRNCIRLAAPWLVRHRPWEIGPDEWDEEERYYWDHCKRGESLSQTRLLTGRLTHPNRIRRWLC